jgi:hypothetical protein
VFIAFIFKCFWKVKNILQYILSAIIG